jgi:diguanylate cyclase (GGDEF)-like protein/PAS domain S-box-containing protein
MVNGVAVYQGVDEGQDFVFVDMNKKGQSLSKVRLDEVVGRRVTEVFPAVERMGLLDVFRRVWRTGLPEEHPQTEYADGRITHWVENYVFKLPSGVIVAVYSDITERKAAEEKVQLLNAELERLALTDHLTNLYNRRYFMQHGAEEIKRANRNKQPLALLMLDIDDFKNVNDRCGHEAGDWALQQVAAALKASLRDTDIIGRLGGEEFGILLPNTPLHAAALLAERIRQSIAYMLLQMPEGALISSITVSVGAAAFTDATTSIDDLLRNADTAMYRAKNSGRNRVEVYPHLYKL